MVEPIKLRYAKAFKMMTTLRLTALNVLAMGLTTVPLLVLERFWGMEKHWVVSILVWFASVAIMYVWILPWLGLEPSPAFWQNLY